MASTQFLHGAGELSHPEDSTWLAHEMQMGFPGRSGSVTVTNAELPCSPEILLRFNGCGAESGFGSQVNNFMNELFLAAYRNNSVALSVSVPFFSTWNSFFVNSLPLCDDKRAPNHRHMCAVETGERRFVEALARTDGHYVTNAKRAIYTAHYRYTNNTKMRIDDTLKKLSLPDAYFGVQIRHGDKVRREARSIDAEHYADVVRSKWASRLAVAHARSAADRIIAMKGLDIRTVWLATLDRSAEDALRESLGAEYEIRTLNQTYDWANNLSSQYWPGSDFVYDILTDVEALRRSHIFIGTASSNLARLVYFLRQPGNNSISLDESFLDRAG
eukprot:CAMPEP_0168380636 /NCGR_PEP_ID=MMETSP0228-20121227/12464_1 /TAXON_ID=133427 /ORGANISM="Protoceratium reticulatum, Strain CCCM 535 (=CCMP 1889)" /LENGTH=330 /DNA_ID=CAMNT_0008393711 /DNA_START=168 /DNA_END=1160 /DNA_ORIENTATION=+